MHVTKYSHSCLRLEHDGAVLVVDPGGFSEPEALDGADAVLVTHEHPDHVDVAALTRALERRAVAGHGPAPRSRGGGGGGRGRGRAGPGAAGSGGRPPRRSSPSRRGSRSPSPECRCGRTAGSTRSSTRTSR